MISEDNITDWDVTPDQISENNELKELLDKAIQKLPADYRVVFLLRDVEGLSTEETGKVTDLSVPAVKSRLHRARAFLRNELNKKLSHEK
jgi:RNA polymerase sigma-70 factor (ECF subfamily)